MNSRIFHITGILLLATTLPAAVFAQGKPQKSDIEKIGKRDINKGHINFTSIAKELEIGRQSAAEVEKMVMLVDDPKVLEYVDRIAQNVAKNSDSQFPITVKVIQSGEVNAFALPGGILYVNTGAIKAADNEAELAFVIADLVGHVAARTTTKNNARGTLMQVASIPTVIVNGGVAGTAVQEQLQTGITSSMFQFSQQAVEEADLLGLEYLYKSGYDPQAAVSFLKKLDVMERARPTKQSSLFSTHPPAAERIKHTEKNITAVLPARTDSILNSSEFDAIKARVMTINTPPSSPLLNTPSLLPLQR